MVGRLHWGDAIWGFETEIPDRKPANLGEAGGTHGSGLFGGRWTARLEAVRWRPVDPTRGEGQVSLAPSPPWFDRAAVSPASFDRDAG